MSAPAGCRIINRWRIVGAEVWDRSHLDLAGPAYLQIGRDGWAEFVVGAAQAGGELEYAKTAVFFRWQGFEEGDEISGQATGELQDDGTIDTEHPTTTAMTLSSSAAANEFFNGLLNLPASIAL